MLLLDPSSQGNNYMEKSICIFLSKRSKFTPIINIIAKQKITM
jgi:hypothetical protein